MLGRLKFDIEPLVNEMLDQLPASVWESDSTTFFDPAMGGGQFLQGVISRLRACGHSDENIQSRVYGMEANQLRVNYAWAKGVIGRFFLGGVEELGNLNMKFDVVLGNPPYQKSNTSSRLGSRGDTSLWPYFVKTSIELIKEKGYLLFIHPNSWRKPNDKHNIWNLLTRHNCLKYLRMYSGKGDQNVFGIGVRVDSYLVQKSSNHEKAIVIDYENIRYNIDLHLWNWFPNYAVNDIEQLLGKGTEVVYNTKYHTQSSSLSDDAIDDYKYPVVHTINQSGLGIKYSNKKISNDVHFDVPKVLLNQNELQYPYNDYQGKYGMSQLTFGIKIDNKTEGDKLVDFLNSELGKRIIAATKWNTFYTNYRMFESFKKDFYHESTVK